MMAIAHSRESFYKLISSFPQRKQILVEGDSWVGHPLPRATNLTVQMNTYLRGRCNIFSMGEIGHLAIDMMSGGQLRAYIDALKAPQHNIALIFFSGGGNDILSHSDKKYQLDKLLTNTGGSDYRKYIKSKLWEELLESVLWAYKTLIKNRDKHRPDCPIVTHTYDFIYPRNQGVDLIKNNIFGPWVYKAMKKAGIDNEKVMREIIKLMLKDFRKSLNKLAAKHNKVFVAQTQGTLEEHQNWGIVIEDWDDEIHPNKSGFAKIMKQIIGPVLQEQLDKT